jgi:hypothetical protein
MWKNRMVASGHRDFDPTALRVEGEPPPDKDMVVTRGPAFGAGEERALKAAIAEYIKERQEDPDLVVPAGQRTRYEAALQRFSSVFPDKFYLRERGRFYPVEVRTDIGRYLSAGVHNMMGYFRDDTPLIEMIIDEQAKKEIDTLWGDFEYITDYTRRTYIQSSNEGAGGGRDGQVPVLSTSYRDLATEKAIFASRDQAIKRFAKADNPEIEEAIRIHFEGSNAAIRWAERTAIESEPRHLDALLRFAARAYRRPLAPEERDEILGYYRELRDKNAMSHEDAVRASIVSLLVSPDFFYRVDLVADGSASDGNRPASLAREQRPNER